MTKVPRHDPCEGVALIMVLAILAALMVLAVPFLSIARNENVASEAPFARAEARSQVDGLLRYARYVLTRGHQASEEGRSAMGAGTRATPGWDTPDEALVPVDLINDKGEPVRDAAGVAYQYPRNPRGVTADLKVRDEQAYPNLLSSPPFLIAHSLGRTVLSEDITPEDTEIAVENAEGFPPERGALWIEGEVITYAIREGGRFLGCQRGAADGLTARPHRAEAVVLDDRARQIAMLPFKSPRAGGGYREPASITYIKELSLAGQDPLTPLEVDRFDRDFTVHGGRFTAGRFGGPVSTLGDVNPESYQGDGFMIRVRSTEPFPPGTVVRVTDGINEEFGMVARRGAGARSAIWLHEPTQNFYDRNRTTVAPLLLHPVNINSASREVLYRLIEGIQIGQGGRADGANGRVDADAAAVVVEGILDRRPIRDLQHFRQVLAELADGAMLFLTEIQAAAIFRNAVNPADPALVYSTLPFCFQSSDHYTIEATAVVNDGGGRELARSSVRERVHVAPLGILELNLDNQAAFDQPFHRSREGQYTVTHPHPVERWESPDFVPASRIPRFLWRFGSLGSFMADRMGGGEDREDLSFQDGVFPNRTEGDVRLLPGRMEGRGYTQHFDGPGYMIPDRGLSLEDLDPEGFRLARRAFEFSPSDPVGSIGGGGRGGGRGRQQGQGSPQGSGALGGRVNPNPVRFDMWYRTGRTGGAGRQVVFDYAIPGTTTESRAQLYIDGDGSLVGRLDDRTVAVPGSGVEEVAEVRWRPESGSGFWRPNTWYHLGFSYRGSKPDDLALWVDGYKRGQARYQTVLTGGLSRTGTFFSVEDADGWPVRGVCMVGSEVIAYERSGVNFDVVSLGSNSAWGRGQRGTRALDHGAGAPVTLFGYSTLPRGVNQRSATVIPSGQVSLSDTLGPMTAAIFAANATIPVSIPMGGGVNVPVQIEVHDPAAPGGNVMTLLGDSFGTLDFDCFPASGGYILIVSMEIAVGGTQVGPVGSIELARYQGRSGNQLLGLSAPRNLTNQGLVEWTNQDPLVAGMPGTLPEFWLSRQIHPVRMLGGGSGPNTIPGVDYLSCVIPISVHVTNTGALLEPQPVSEQSETGVDRWNTDPQFIEVGVYDLENLSNHNIEWIRYHHMDEDGNLLCDEVKYLSRLALYMRGRHLARPQGILGAEDFLQYALPMRMQCGTDELSRGRPTAGSRIVPCIRTVAHGTAINVSGGQPGSPTNGQPWSAAGWGDRVTIEGVGGRDVATAAVSWAAIDRVQRTIAIGDPPEEITVPVSRQGYEQGWISLTENLTRSYRQPALPGNGEPRNRNRSQYARLLKFPSGELPEMRGARAFAGGTVDGEISDQEGYVDEIRVSPFNPERFILWDHQAMNLSSTAGGGARGIDAMTDEIPFADVRWVVSNPVNFGATPRFYILPDGRKIHYEEGGRGLPRNNAGVVQIGEELIAFRGIGQGASGAPALLQCERGILGTDARSHGFGSNVVFLDFKDVSMLTNALDPASDAVEVRSGRVFPGNQGTVLINSEMIHYTQIQGNQLVMPLRAGEDGESLGGMFRGRYGTTPARHDAESIVYDMPFRYWDRYVPGQDSAELAWYGFGLDLKDAYFHTIALDVERPNSRTAVEMLIRLDSRTPWTAAPGAAGLHLLASDEPGEQLHAVNSSGDGFSARVYFKYLSGAIDPHLMETHDWKSTPILRSIRLRYLDQTRVIEREVLR